MTNKINKVYDIMDNVSMKIWEISNVNKKAAKKLTQKLDELNPESLLEKFNNNIDEIVIYLEDIFSVMNAFE